MFDNTPVSACGNAVILSDRVFQESPPNVNVPNKDEDREIFAVVVYRRERRTMSTSVIR